jgi:nucleoside-diphosphate-sugar epimerase
MERINVFGGSGFIGSAFCAKYPDDIVVNDRNCYSIQTTNILYLISTVDNYNVYENPYLDIETNLITLIKVLENCRDKDVVFNFISSWFVYGDTDSPAREDSYCNPKGFYSITKRAAEQLLISYCETFGIKYRILRLANVLGKNDTKASPKKNALQYMIQRIKDGEEVSLYNGGLVYRDYIHVDDVVDAIHLILSKGELNTIYNVGNGESISIAYALEYVAMKTGYTLQFKNIPPSDFHKIVQTTNMALDTSRIRALGYAPKYSIEETLEKLI